MNHSKNKQLIKKLNLKQALTIYQSVAEHLDENQKRPFSYLVWLKKIHIIQILGFKSKEMQHLIKDNRFLFQELLVHFAKNIAADDTLQSLNELDINVLINVLKTLPKNTYKWTTTSSS